MKFGFLLHHNGHRADREEIKNIIQTNTIEEAKTKLNNLIIESDTEKNNFNDDTTIDIDNKSLHHAQEHIINVVIPPIPEDPEEEPEPETEESIVQKNAAMRALDETVDE